MLAQLKLLKEEPAAIALALAQELVKVEAANSKHRTAFWRIGRWSPLSASPLTRLQKQSSIPETKMRPQAFASAFWKNGSPGKIRTCDQPINSRLLYR